MSYDNIYSEEYKKTFEYKSYIKYTILISNIYLYTDQNVLVIFHNLECINLHIHLYRTYVYLFVFIIPYIYNNFNL